MSKKLKTYTITGIVEFDDEKVKRKEVQTTFSEKPKKAQKAFKSYLVELMKECKGKKIISMNISFSDEEGVIMRSEQELIQK